MKKITAIILSLMLVLSCATPVFASDSHNNNVPYKSISKSARDAILWLYDGACDIADYGIHAFQNFKYGSKTLTDEATGVSVTFSNKRFGARTDEITLFVRQLSQKEVMCFSYDEPKFEITTVNREIDGQKVSSYYIVKLLDKNGELAEPDPGMEYHQMKFSFNLPEKHLIDIYGVEYTYPDGSRQGFIDYTYPVNGRVYFIMNGFDQ